MDFRMVDLIFCLINGRFEVAARRHKTSYSYCNLAVAAMGIDASSEDMRALGLSKQLCFVHKYTFICKTYVMASLCHS